MFNFQYWIEVFKGHWQEHGEAYNDTASLVGDDIVVIEKPQNTIWKILGIHHLTPSENQGNHNVYIEVLCKQWARNLNQVVHWTWEGRTINQNAPDIWAGQKPENELVNIPLNLGMVVSVWTNSGEKVSGLSSNHPDEAPGNKIGHHSFFICFQEVGTYEEPKKAVMTIDRVWLDQQIIEDGMIKIYV